MLDIVVRALREVPLDIRDDLSHVGMVVFGEAAAALLNCDDAPAGLMADGLGLALVMPADRLAFLGLKPVSQL